MVEETAKKKSGNRGTNTGMETLDGKVRKAVENAGGSRIDWSQAFDTFKSAAQHAAQASAKKVPLFETARPGPVDRHLKTAKRQAPRASAPQKDEFVGMVDDEVLRRPGWDIRGKFF